MIKRCFPILSVLLLACSTTPETTSETATVRDEANDYPDITFVLPTGETVRTRDLSGSNVFIFFSPDCGHCHDEAEAIAAHLPRFSDYTLWFVSSHEMAAITEFARIHDLDGKDRVHFGWSAPEGVLDFYGPIRTPATYVYVDGKLTGSFSGSTPVDSLLNVL